jgi:hypothetical protein
MTNDITIAPDVADLPSQVLPGRMMLEDLFSGDDNKDLREQILRSGKYTPRHSNKELRIQTRRMEDGRHEIMALAALSRDPGKTSDYLTNIADFADTASKPTTNLSTKVLQYRQIYRNEGIVNNAINKMAAMLGVGGRFKVRHARKGKSRKALEDLQMLLDYFAVNVNSAPMSGVVTSERGMKNLIHHGARQALVEGDWIARQQWAKVTLPNVSGTVSLPMTIQTLSLTSLEPINELSGLGELWYWKPDSQLLQLITKGSKVKEINDVVKKLVDNKTKAELQKNQKVLLTPALLLHVKHRGFATDPIGESMIEPAKLGIRMYRALTAIDMVSMENVINRLTIVQVGSADPKSPYSKADVAAARAALMQSFFEDISPSMVIVWQGDDVKVQDVGSQDSVLDLNDRYRIAENQIKMSLGIPDALLIGRTSEGSSATWASMVGAAAQLQELANAFAAVFTTMGERIAFENGFDGVDLMWEFDQSLMADFKETRTQNRSDYLLGLSSIKTMIAAAGRDPDAEFLQKCEERGLNPDTSSWADVFSPPQGLQGQAPGGVQGFGDGKDPSQGRAEGSEAESGEP